MYNQNMVDVLEGIKDADHKFLCHCVNTYSDKERVDVHLGTLPFINRKLVRDALLSYRAQLSPDNEKAFRQVKRILDALQFDWNENSVTFQMKLVPEKVYKHLGRKVGTSFEVKLPFNASREAGIRWKEFGKKFEKPEMLVIQVAKVRQVGRDLWEVTCPKVGNDRIREWFFTKFG